MRILLKYATRGRPELFVRTILLWNATASGEHDISWLVSLDNDDTSMANEAIKAFCREKGIQTHYGPNKSKIEAINANMDEAPDWDVVIVVSDDMEPVIPHWDKAIADEMANLDMALWFPDGNQKQICTLTIMGRELYKRFNHIYDPEFKSLYCDEFYTRAVQRMGRMKYLNAAVFRHAHKENNDDYLMAVNEQYYAEDKATFERKTKDFPKVYNGDVRDAYLATLAKLKLNETADN